MSEHRVNTTRTPRPAGDHIASGSLEAFLGTFDDAFIEDSSSLPNLVGVVDGLVDQIEAGRLVPQSVWEPWLRALEAARQLIEDQGLKRDVATGYFGNPLGGRFSRFPIMACLLQETRREVVARYRGFSILLLARLVNGSSERNFKVKAQRLSTQLRVAGSNPDSPRGRALAALPAFDPQKAEQSLRDLEEGIEQQLEVLSSKDKATELLRRLRWLVITSESAIQDEPPPWIAEEYPGPPDIVDDPPSVSAEVKEEAQGRPKNDLGEPTESRIRLTADSSTIPLTRSGLTADARQLGHWQKRFRRRVPVDRGLLNPIERRRVSEHLREALEKDGIRGGSFLLALMYVTGLDGKDLLGANLGKTFHEGAYRRLIEPPADAVDPSQNMVATGWEPPTRAVELPLPRFIGDLLPRKSSTMTLGEALGTDESTSEASIADELDILRCNGQFPGMHRQRIPAQLRAVLSAHVRNPAIVYHLTGREVLSSLGQSRPSLGQSQPSLVYYMSIPATQLVAAYERATAFLLPAP